MGYKLTKGERVEFEKVPAGNHRAVIVAVIEMGTHVEEAYKKGAPDVSRFKINLVYELLDVEKEDGKDAWIIGHTYTASNFADAPIMKVCAAAFQRPMAKDEEPDLEKLVFRVVLVNVVHEAGKADPSKIFDKVKDVSPIPDVMKKMPVRPKYVPCYHALGTYAEHDWHPRIFGVKVVDKIKESSEARAGFKSAPVNATTHQQVQDVVEEAIATNAPQTPTRRTATPQVAQPAAAMTAPPDGSVF